MSFTYRKPSLDDEDEVFKLAASLATSYKLNKGDFSRIYHDILSNPNADILIAEKDSNIIGYVLVFHHSTFYANGEVSWVEELFVLDEYRGMKIGKQLMELCERKAIERGSKMVALATRRAGDFYNAIGYEESAVYFKKKLSDD
ncbi:GNAT family N-acetyltransferase [Paenibacillus tarimensis]